eukprot:m.237227 g.237227  ORF g.237227 m.237227 type:complete len:1084 (-) comp15268_c1_seq12:1425-4676(-)
MVRWPGYLSVKWLWQTEVATKRFRFLLAVLICILSMLAEGNASFAQAASRSWTPAVSTNERSRRADVLPSVANCTAQYATEFNAILSGHIPPNACSKIFDFGECLLSAFESNSTSATALSIGQGLLYQVARAAACQDADSFLWQLFLPDPDKISHELTQIGGQEPQFTCAWDRLNTTRTDPNAATYRFELLSGLFNRPDPGVVGIDPTCANASHCHALYRHNLCFSLACGDASDSGVCLSTHIASISVVGASSAQSLGNSTPTQVNVLTDGRVRLDYFSADTLGSLVPSAVMDAALSFLGIPNNSLINAALQSPSAMQYTHVYYVCDPEQHALPRLEAISQESEYGILTRQFMSVAHRCACENAENCTGPFTQNPNVNTTAIPPVDVNIEALQKVLTAFNSAFIIIFVLATRRRVTKPKFLNGWIGIPFPMNFLENRTSRFLSCAIFVIFGTRVTTSLLGFDGSTDRKSFEGEWYNEIIVLLRSFVVTLNFYPLYLASTAEITWLGCSLGLVYVGALLYIQIYAFQFMPPMLYIISILQIGAGLIVGLLFIVKLVRVFQKKSKHAQLTWRSKESDLLNQHYYNPYVKRLFKQVEKANKTDAADDADDTIGCWTSMCNTVSSACGQAWKTVSVALSPSKEHAFQTSPRLLATAVMSLVASAALSVVAIFASSSLKDIVSRLLLNTGADLQCSALPGYAVFPPQGQFNVFVSLNLGCEDNDVILSSLVWCLYLAALLSTAFQFVFLLLLFAKHKTRLQRLARGDRSHLPPKMPSPAASVAAAVKYAGFQTVYTFSGWIILCLCFFIVLATIAYGFVLPFMGIYGHFLWNFVLQQLPPLILSLLIHYGQFYICRYVFLIVADSVGIQHRRWFFNFDLLMVLFNAVVGVLSFLTRWLYTIAFSVLFVARLDVATLPRGYELMDPGFYAYLGFLQVDYYYSNPTFLTFARILIEDQQARLGSAVDLKSTSVARRATSSHIQEDGYVQYISDDESGDDAELLNDLHHGLNDTAAGELLDMKAAYAIDEDGVKIMSPAKRRRVARNRWHLAVVLMQNPSLVKDRRTVKDDDDRGDSTEPTSEVSDVEMDV